MALLNDVWWFAGADALLAAQRAELPQKDDLCGPFWGLVALRAGGVTQAPGGGPLDQDAVAIAAGSLLSPPPRDGSRPPGQAGRDDYRLALPVVGAGEAAGSAGPSAAGSASAGPSAAGSASAGAGTSAGPSAANSAGAGPSAADSAGAGTSAGGLARAVATLSARRLTAVPATGARDAGRLLALLDDVSATAVLANVDVARLREAATDAPWQRRYLETGVDDGPRSEWRVGHFVAIAGSLAGPAGTLLALADTYASRGRDGVHLQPAPAVAAALRGLLIVTSPAGADAIAHRVRTAGLQVELWNNGSADARETDVSSP